MNEQFTTVSRDEALGTRIGSQPSSLSTAVLATAVSGQALRVELNGLSAKNLGMNLRNLGLRHGLRVRTRKAESGLVMFVWAEKQEKSA